MEALYKCPLKRVGLKPVACPRRVFCAPTGMRGAIPPSINEPPNVKRFKDNNIGENDNGVFKKAGQSQSVSPRKRNLAIEREAETNPFAGLFKSEKMNLIKKSKIKSTFGIAPVTQYMDRKSNVAFSKQVPKNR